MYIFMIASSSSSSYIALQPAYGSGLLSYFLPAISILYYFLPIAYVALVVLKSSVQHFHVEHF